MKRELTKREKILILVFILFLIAMGWYKLIYTPIQDEIVMLNTNMVTEQSNTEINMLKVQDMKRMEKELEEVKQNGSTEPMPFYDNSKNLMGALNKILLAANEYNLSFDTVTTNDYLIIRPIQLYYSTDTYAQARDIIDQLSKHSYYNQISDLIIQMNTGNDKEQVLVSLLITFYEVVNN